MARPAAALTWTVNEAAAAIGVGKNVMWDLVAAGTVPTMRIGRRVLISKKALEAWLDEHADSTISRTNKNAPGPSSHSGTGA